MIHLFEWIGELFSRGGYGAVEFDGEPNDREPLYLVLLKFFVAVFILAWVNYLVFSYLAALTPRSIVIATGLHLFYFLLGYFVRR